MAQVAEQKIGYPKFLSSKLWCCSFDRESFNAWRNNTRYLPTLATIITIWKTRIASLDLRSWQNPIWKYALLRGNRVRDRGYGGGEGAKSYDGEKVWSSISHRCKKVSLAPFLLRVMIVSSALSLIGWSSHRHKSAAWHKFDGLLLAYPTGEGGGW